jgi:hypothetical protein
VYSWPSDDLLALAFAGVGGASVSLDSGTLDTGYVLSSLSSGSPSAGVLFTTDHFAIIIDHGSAVSLKLPAMIHTNGRKTATSFFQRNATNSWGSPSVNVSWTLTDAEPDGLRPNPWLDRRADAAFRYTRLGINTGSGVPLYIGQIILSALFRQLTMNIAPTPKFTPTFKTIINATNSGVHLKTVKGVRIKMLQADRGIQTVNAFPDIYNWFLASNGMAQNFLLIPDPNVNDAWYAEWNSDTAAAFSILDPTGNVSDVAPGWNELSRGAVLL